MKDVMLDEFDMVDSGEDCRAEDGMAQNECSDDWWPWPCEVVVDCSEDTGFGEVKNDGGDWTWD